MRKLRERFKESSTKSFSEKLYKKLSRKLHKKASLKSCFEKPIEEISQKAPEKTAQENFSKFSTCQSSKTFKTRTKPWKTSEQLKISFFANWITHDELLK